MAAIVVGSTLQMRVFCSVNNQVSINIMHYVVASAAGPYTDGDLVVGMDSYFNTYYKDCLSANAAYSGIGLRVIGLLPPPAEVFSNSGAGAGDGGAALMPTQVSGLLSWLTPYAGRDARGRLYVPFPSTADSVDATGLPSAAYQTKISGLAQALITDVRFTPAGVATVLTPIIVHKKDGTYTGITGARVGTGWATQRRRGSYGRPNSLPWQV